MVSLPSHWSHGSTAVPGDALSTCWAFLTTTPFPLRRNSKCMNKNSHQCSKVTSLDYTITWLRTTTKLS